jgi:hypothetical protein
MYKRSYIQVCYVQTEILLELSINSHHFGKSTWEQEIIEEDGDT